MRKKIVYLRGKPICCVNWDRQDEQVTDTSV